LAGRHLSHRSAGRRDHQAAAGAPFLDREHPIDFVIDLCLVAVLFVVPLAMGGRGDVGKLLMTTLVVVATLGFAVQRLIRGGLKWRWTGVEIPLLLGLLLVVVQIVPLDPAVLQRVSPELTRLLAGHGAGLPFPQWETLSANVYATRGAISIYLAYVLYFFLIVHRLQSLPDIEKVLRCVAGITVLMAAIGLLQRFAGNGHFLWFYQHPLRDTYGTVKGTFSNPNHFAHFMALGTGCLIWWWMDTVRPSSSASRRSQDSLLSKLLPCAISIVLFAALLSFSRGGCLVLLVAMTLIVGMWWSLGRLNWRVLTATGLVGFPLVAGLAIYGAPQLSSELVSLKELGNVQEVANGRQALWSALQESGSQFLWTGSGLGTHQDLYPVYMEEHFEFNFSHGESGYLQLFAEAGLLACLLLLLVIRVVFRWSREAFQAGMTSSFIAAAIIPAIAASLLHSFFDFVWYLSGCMAVTIALLACLVRVVQLERAASASNVAEVDARSGPFVHPTVAAWSLAATGLLLAAMVVQDRLPRALASPHWGRYVRISSALTGGESTREQRDRFASMHRSLADAIRLDPSNPRSRLRLATVSIRRFDLEQEFADNSMTIGQIREAVELSNFETKKELDSWLTRAFGTTVELLHMARRQALFAAARSPLQGTAYLHLSELDFLTPENSIGMELFIRQASIVRPHDAAVQFALGAVAARKGEQDRAVGHWQAAFIRDQETRLRIIQTLGPQLPAGVFIQMFMPTTPDLGRLLALYNQLGNVAEANYVAIRYAASLERDARKYEGKAASDIWWIAQSVYAGLGDVSRQTYAVAQAVSADPHDVIRRVTLAGLYFDQHKYVEALAEYEWCVRRRPGDKSLRRRVREASLHSMDNRNARNIDESAVGLSRQ
jgi:O-antigen ligase